MSNVVNLELNKGISRETVVNLRVFDNCIGDAIDNAKRSGLPQGFVVAILHGYAQRETQEMIE